MAISYKEFIKINPNYVGAAYVKPEDVERWKKKEEPKEEPKKRNLWQSLLPAAGAIGAGLVAAPFTGGLSLAGTIAAMGAAGAAGGALGEIGAQTVSGEKDDGYDFGDIFQEGGLSGAFGAGGTAFAGLRGLHAAKAAGASDDVARMLANRTASGQIRAKNIANIVGQAKGGADDVARLSTMTGKEAFGAKARGLGALDKSSTKVFPKNAGGVGAIDDTVRRVDVAGRYKVPAGKKGLSVAKNEVSKLNGRLSTRLKKEVIDIDDIVKSTDDFFDNQLITSMPEKTVNRIKNKFISTLKASAKNGKIDLEDVRKARSALKQNAFKGATSESKEVIQQGYRHLNNFVRGAGDDVAGMLDDLSTLQDMASGLATRTGDVRVPFFGANISIPGLGGLKDRSVDLASALSGATSGVTPQVIRQGVPRLGLTSMMQQPTEEVAAPQETYTPPQNADLAGGYPVNTLEGALNAQGGSLSSQVDTSAYSPQNIQATVEQILNSGGDYKDVKDYLSIAETMRELMGGQGGMANLTANQKNKVSGLQSGLGQIDILEDLYSRVNKSQSQLTAGLGGLPGVKQTRTTIDPNAREYIGFAEGTLAPLIRSLGESGVLTDEDRNKALGAIPNLGDSEPVAINKLKNIRALLNKNINTVMSGGTGTESSNILAQLIEEQYAGGLQ